MLVIVPNVMGICLWSPPLDEVGNSVRGTEFCKELIRGYSFHRYSMIYCIINVCNLILLLNKLVKGVKYFQQI